MFIAGKFSIQVNYNIRIRRNPDGRLDLLVCGDLLTTATFFQLRKITCKIVKSEI